MVARGFQEDPPEIREFFHGNASDVKHPWRSKPHPKAHEELRCTPPVSPVASVGPPHGSPEPKRVLPSREDPPQLRKIGVQLSSKKTKSRWWLLYTLMYFGDTPTVHQRRKSRTWAGRMGCYRFDSSPGKKWRWWRWTKTLVQYPSVHPKTLYVYWFMDVHPCHVPQRYGAGCCRFLGFDTSLDPQPEWRPQNVAFDMVHPCHRHGTPAAAEAALRRFPRVHQLEVITNEGDDKWKVMSYGCCDGYIIYIILVKIGSSSNVLWKVRIGRWIWGYWFQEIFLQQLPSRSRWTGCCCTWVWPQTFLECGWVCLSLANFQMGVLWPLSHINEPSGLPCHRQNSCRP